MSARLPILLFLEFYRKDYVAFRTSRTLWQNRDKIEPWNIVSYYYCMTCSMHITIDITTHSNVEYVDPRCACRTPIWSAACIPWVNECCVVYTVMLVFFTFVKRFLYNMFVFQCRCTYKNGIDTEINKKKRLYGVYLLYLFLPLFNLFQKYIYEITRFG